MPVGINLDPYFSPMALKEAFEGLKLSKTDLFNPTRVRIPTGADGITWQDFERNLDRNVANISRTVLNGIYQFYPFREFAVSKEDKSNRLTFPLNLSPNSEDHQCPDGVRILSIARIRDVIVQKQLYSALRVSAESIFASSPMLDKVSYAYRPGKSAPKAASRISRTYCSEGYRYAFEADIQKFFDTLDHVRLVRLIDEWVGRDSISGKLLWRFIRTDKVPFDSYPGEKDYFANHRPLRCKRIKGVPQGGVLSGLLANLYLHEFDCWIINDLSASFDIRYFRYADDVRRLTGGFIPAASGKGEEGDLWVISPTRR